MSSSSSSSSSSSGRALAISISSGVGGGGGRSSLLLGGQKAVLSNDNKGLRGNLDYEQQLLDDGKSEGRETEINGLQRKPVSYDYYFDVLPGFSL